MKPQSRAAGCDDRLNEIKRKAEPFRDFGDLLLSLLDFKFPRFRHIRFSCEWLRKASGVAGFDFLRHVVIEQPGTDIDRGCGAVFRIQHAAGQHPRFAAAGQKIDVLAVPLRIEIEEFRFAGAGVVHSRAERGSPIAAETPSRGKEIRAVVVFPALKIQTDLVVVLREDFDHLVAETDLRNRAVILRKHIADMLP